MTLLLPLMWTLSDPMAARGCPLLLGTAVGGVPSISPLWPGCVHKRQAAFSITTIITLLTITGPLHHHLRCTSSAHPRDPCEARMLVYGRVRKAASEAFSFPRECNFRDGQSCLLIIAASRDPATYFDSGHTIHGYLIYNYHHTCWLLECGSAKERTGAYLKCLLKGLR
jgi:hypothetical protein